MKVKIKNSERDRWEYLFLLAILIGWTILVGFAACHSTPSSKINFPFQELDQKGLSGKGNGKVAVSYEFCLLKDAVLKKKVQQIDSTLRSCYKTSAGLQTCLFRQNCVKKLVV